MELLTFENIALFCVLSFCAGFGGRSIAQLSELAYRWWVKRREMRLLK